MTAWGGGYARRLVRLTLETWGEVCHLCLTEGATTADHVIPRSRGGDDSIDNLRPAHGSCNSSRGDMSMTEWWAKRALLVDARAWFAAGATEGAADSLNDASQDTPRQHVDFSPPQNKTDLRQPCQTVLDIDPNAGAFFDW